MNLEFSFDVGNLVNHHRNEEENDDHRDHAQGSGHKSGDLGRHFFSCCGCLYEIFQLEQIGTDISLMFVYDYILTYRRA